MDLKAIAEEEARRAGVPLEFFMRLITKESNWNPKAKSHVGAYGLTQVMPATWKQPGYGVTPGGNIDDPREQIRFGADYAAAMLNAYDGDQRKAAGAYNAGPGTMNKWDGDPASLPKETRDYMNIVGGGKQGAGVGGYGVGAAVDGTKLGFGNAVEGSTMDGYEDRQPYRYKGALTDFAGDMLDASKSIGTSIGALNDSSNAITDYQHKMIDPEYRLAAGRDTTISGSLPSKVMGGAGGSVQGAAGADTLLPNGQPMMPNMSKVPLSKGVPVGGVSGGGDSPAVQGGGGGAPVPTAAPQETGGGFMSKLFGERGSDKRQGSADILAALSQGLGQMSHGAPVDMSNVFQRIQRRQEFASAQEAQAARDKQAAEQFDRTLAVQQQNADTAAAKLLADGAATGPKATAAWDALAAQYPELAKTVIPLARSGNKEAQKEALDYATNASIARNEELSPEGRAALGAYIAADSAGGRAAALTGLPSAELEKVATLGGTLIGQDPRETSAITTGERMFRERPQDYSGGVGQAIKEAANIAAGIVPGRNDTLVKHDIEQGSKYYNEALGIVNSTHEDLTALDMADGALADMAKTGSETDTMVTPVVTSIAQAVGSLTGSDPMYNLLDRMGIDVNANAELSVAQTALMRAITQSYQGQGTISDAERAQMVKEVLNPNQTTRGMMSVSARLRADRQIKQNNAARFTTQVKRGEAYSNWGELKDVEVAQKTDERAIVNAALKQADFDWAISELDGLGMTEVLEKMTPEMEKTLHAQGKEAMQLLRRMGSERGALMHYAPRISGAVARNHVNTLPQTEAKDPATGEWRPARVYINSATGKLTPIFEDK